MFTDLAPQIDAHTNDGSNGCIHALRIASAGEYGDALALVRATLNETLIGQFICHYASIWFDDNEF